ncbi:hypothetical protein M3Y94_00039700 [Aphelenchoides besseyi]|nr:hypothetical protein M3Y94_00039700 [Aphelenchoides besseyi]KAI6219085.1 hypothetical protein M3Y95_01129300 [Aphelenchoides besseyi]
MASSKEDCENDGREVSQPKNSEANEKNFCSHCGSDVDGKLSFHLHTVHWQLKTIRGPIFVCALCSFRSWDMNERDEHFRSEHSDHQMKPVYWSYKMNRMFHCWLCEYSTPKRKTFNLHCMQKHYDVWFTMTDANGTQARKKKNKKLTPPQMKCVSCPLRISGAEYFEHNRDAHLARLTRLSMIFLCPECPYRSYDYKSRDKHIRNNHPEVDVSKPLVYNGDDNTYHCDCCVASYSNLSSLMEHFYLVHNEKNAAQLEQENLSDGEELSDDEVEKKGEVNKKKSESSIQEVNDEAKTLKRKNEKKCVEPSESKKPKMDAGDEEKVSVQVADGNQNSKSQDLSLNGDHCQQSGKENGSQASA